MPCSAMASEVAQPAVLQCLHHYWPSQAPHKHMTHLDHGSCSSTLTADGSTCMQSLPMVLERQLGEPVTVPCYGDVRRATRRASPLKERSLCPGMPQPRSLGS